MAIPAWLQKYLDRGFHLVSYAPKTKGPREEGWQKAVFDPEKYKEGQNIGVMTGAEIAPGKFLVDVDLDWTDGVPMTKRLLPSTNFGIGRASRKISHAFYTTSVPLVSKAFDDITGKPFVEIRGAKADGSLGFQTMIPPSIHPNEETIELRLDGEIGHADDLARKVSLYAIACLLYQHVGHRGLLHDVRLSLAGFLLKSGLSEEEAILVGESVAEVTGNNISDVAVTVRSTAERIRKGEKVSGKTALAKAIGDPDGPKVVSRVIEWLGEKEFITDKNGRPIAGEQENVLRALEKLHVELHLDEFSRKYLVKFEGFDGELSDEVREWIWLEIDKRFGFRPPSDLFEIMLRDQARRHPVHPVRGYLQALVWDGTPRLDTWLSHYGGAADTDYTRAVGALVLIAAVRRIFQPGCKFDELLILESPQGTLKSSALRALCADDSWFSDDLPLNVDAKQIIERTTGKWIIEASELSGMRDSLREHLKGMLSRQSDGPVRLAYGRFPVERKRQFIIIGTTNDFHYLMDITGNRRFWPVRVEKFHSATLATDRDQIWAEAVAREAQHEPVRLAESLWPTATIQQERRRLGHPWEDILSKHFEGTDEYQRIAPDELWEILGVSSDRLNVRGNRDLATIMQFLGFRKMTVQARDGKICLGWARGASKRGKKLPLEEPSNGS